ncbi:hypothetical protein P4O66_014265 [Electrophorus voltai]|uniref:Lipase maturation factor n=1 Tax=Electrophorus voltai TaxID=2609070 RepID=A0AAD9DPH1_9TELE|nr:hypothetical protein P4O66_014265 [Electrophorus voltai]
MGDVRVPRQLFLRGVAVAYLCAFASLYIQIPGRKCHIWRSVSSTAARLALSAGLYGDEGILPARLLVAGEQKPLLQQLQESPSLLWLAPSLGLGPQQGLELICLLGALLSLGAVLLGALRDSLAYLCLWILYLSLYTVSLSLSLDPLPLPIHRESLSVSGSFTSPYTLLEETSFIQSGRLAAVSVTVLSRMTEWFRTSLSIHCLFFPSDSLLLEVGFLAFLVAPCGLLRSSTSPGLHDPVTFWLTRWLLFRLVLCTGLSKLASSDPCWWDLTALSRYYETQASPTPLAWYAHQLPDWLSRLGAVCVMASEIAVPLLMFFAPVRGLRICGFYIQVFLQLCLVLLGGCSLMHLLSVVLSFSLLDDDCFSGCTHQKKKPKSKTWSQFLLSCLALLVKLAVYVLILLGTIKLFKLEINWEQKIVLSKTNFTQENFSEFVSLIQAPTIWVGVLSLTWEAVVTMLRCACVRGIMGKLCALTQWAIFTATTVAVFTLSLVPYTAVAGVSAGKIFREVQNAYGAVEKYQLVSAYGIQHRMVPPAGRPEVIIEGSGDKKTWKELSFMHKPSSVSEAPPVLGPHKPRLDWLLWEAARADYQHSHWFTGLVQQLLLGKQDGLESTESKGTACSRGIWVRRAESCLCSAVVLRLLQVDEAQYPFRVSPPAFLRASVYHYRFTQTGQDGNQPREWWKRRYVREFFPAVHLGDPVLEELLQEAGLKEKFPVLPISDTPLAQALSVLRGHARGHSGPLVLLTLFTTVASILLLKDLVSRSRTPKGPKPKSKPATSEHKSKKPREAHPEASEKNRGPSGRGGRKEGLEERRIDSDRSPRKRKQQAESGALPPGRSVRTRSVQVMLAPAGGKCTDLRRTDTLLALCLRLLTLTMRRRNHVHVPLSEEKKKIRLVQESV